MSSPKMACCGGAAVPANGFSDVCRHTVTQLMHGVVTHGPVHANGMRQLEGSLLAVFAALTLQHTSATHAWQVRDAAPVLA